MDFNELKLCKQKMEIDILKCVQEFECETGYQIHNRTESIESEVIIK